MAQRETGREGIESIRKRKSIPETDGVILGGSNNVVGITGNIDRDDDVLVARKDSAGEVGKIEDANVIRVACNSNRISIFNEFAINNLIVASNNQFIIF